MTEELALAVQLRRCILSAIPERLYDEAPRARATYIPHSHVKALDPTRALIMGDRGTGKTFWWETLASKQLGPHLLSTLYDTKNEGLTFQVSVGYGAKTLPDGRPLDVDTISRLFAETSERNVWKTIVLEQVAPETLSHLQTWSQRASWVHEHPEDVARVLAVVDERLFAQKRRHLIVFDAIDRTGPTWKEVVRAHRGLFGLLLDLWGMRALRAKAFVRNDVLLDPEVLRFPDASKLQAAAVSLNWHRTDLYGLLWKYLANSDADSEAFRHLTHATWSDGGPAGWEVPSSLRYNEDAQQSVWHRIAGPWMGTNKRRGDTYRWLTNHLADAFGHVTPRSFLAAVRAAAEATSENDNQSISQRGIHEGVRGAADVRALEIKEDFPWAEQALESLRDIMVPCPIEEVIAAWNTRDLTVLLEQDPEARRRHRHGQNLYSVISDLADLGVMQILPAGRINVPDVYRLRFGIKRRGGVAARQS